MTDSPSALRRSDDCGAPRRSDDCGGGGGTADRKFGVSCRLNDRPLDDFVLICFAPGLARMFGVLPRFDRRLFSVNSGGGAALGGGADVVVFKFICNFIEPPPLILVFLSTGTLLASKLVNSSMYSSNACSSV